MTAASAGPGYDDVALLTDGVVALSPHGAEHASELFEAAYASRAEVGPWLPWCHPEYRLEEAREWSAARRAAWGDEKGFAVREATGASAGRFVGGCGLNAITMGRCNLGYWTRTDAVGRGVAFRAARLVALFALDELGLQRVEIVTAVGNDASQRVAEKLGAQREGVLRRRLVFGDSVHDAVMNSLTPDDLERLRRLV